MVYVKRIKSNGSPLLNKQCLTCGEADGKAYKMVLNFNDFPDYSEEKREAYYINQNIEREEKKQKERNAFFLEYNLYLKSETWMNKRTLVLKRDNYTCQSCLISQATQVHHTTYRHVYNELLFELVSVCKQCHDLITKLDRGE